MKTVADVNVAFAILVARHVHHPAAWGWWEAQADAAVGLCWPVRLGVLRLLTNAKAMNGMSVATHEALDAWDQLALDPRTWSMEPAPSSHETFFRRNVTGRSPSPNLWMDAWLAALAESSGCRLTSFDSDFRSFGLRDFEHLVG